MIPCSKIMRGERSVHNERKTGPLFVWNVISRCNLLCSHCYRDSQAGMEAPDLSDEKCLELVSQIKAVNPPIVLLTGGEPLLRKNIFDLIKECKNQGLRVGLSTNGTLIDKSMAQKISQAGVDYVGISIDGKKEHHDVFRGSKGAYDASWAGLKILNELGVKTGVRFTLTAANSGDLMDILEKTVASGCKRFCLYHLVYAGRASKDLDMTVKAKRDILKIFFTKVKELSAKDPSFDVLTTDNPADGIFMSKIIDDGEAAMSCIMAHGGCSAGDRVVYLDSTGDVYPCQFLRDHSLGNVKDQTFLEIWENHSNEFLQQLRNKKGLLQGVCGECAHKGICGGCRARAKAFHGSLWAEDPACYLNENEKNGV
ncbi:MAG: radical SAM protein [Candidatus Omnitrophica bacterium]|nr:radical SAM protein [Candidatus Omnitrophota bacterium]